MKYKNLGKKYLYLSTPSIHHPLQQCHAAQTVFNCITTPFTSQPISYQEMDFYVIGNEPTAPVFLDECRVQMAEIVKICGWLLECCNKCLISWSKYWKIEDMGNVNRFIAALCLVAAIGFGGARAEDLVILTTNDTHSQIDPDYDGRGGILRRKALIDSVRNAEKYTLLVDAGDIVQGTLYFSLYGGAVEYPLLDSLGYDISVLGNHEFDNGIDSLAYRQNSLKVAMLSANYGLASTKLNGRYRPYVIKEYAGKRFGIMGINLNPEGMIDMANCKGLVYNNCLEVANETAKHLKRQEKVDFVIMVSHIGYDMPGNDSPGDIQIIKSSKDIDLVIGGHSHTVIDPDDVNSVPWKVANKEGREIPVTQTGKSGKNVGCIKIDLDSLTVDYDLIPVDARWDSKVDYPSLEAFLEPFQKPVHAKNNHVLVQSDGNYESSSVEMQNWVADMAFEITTNLSEMNIDLAIMNKGGIRQSMPEGDVSEGLIGAMFPFNNKLVVIDVTGEELIDAFEVMASRGGDAVSNNVKVLYKKDGTVEAATVRGMAVNRAKIYRVATLDYLAHGGDHLSSFENKDILYSDSEKFGERVLDYVTKMGLNDVHIGPSSRARMQCIN